MGTALTQPPAQLDGGDMSSLSGLFSPSLLESVGKSPPFEYFANNTNGSNGSRSSTDSANGNMSTGHNTSYSSPSASSNSNHGPSSSCGTSPEPTIQSPVYNKPLDSTLTTIGEEHPATTATGEGELTFCDKLNMAVAIPTIPFHVQCLSLVRIQEILKTPRLTSTGSTGSPNKTITNSIRNSSVTTENLRTTFCRTNLLETPSSLMLSLWETLPVRSIWHQVLLHLRRTWSLRSTRSRTRMTKLFPEKIPHKC